MNLTEHNDGNILLVKMISIINFTMLEIAKKEVFMANIIVVAIIAIIVALDIRYIYKQKKSGKACIGCSGGCSGGCSCSKTGYNKK